MSPAHLEILKTLIDMERTGKLDRASFDDLPINLYHHPDCPGISSTTIKTVLKRSWNHVGVKTEERDAFRFGSAFHCFNNEPLLFTDQYYICPFNWKRGEDWEQAKARASNKVMLMQKEFDMIKIMSKKLWLHPDAAELLTGAQFEITYFSRDAETGVLKKCRVDAIKNKIISDLKTTFDASPESFRYDAKKYGYGISAAFYCGVVSEFYGQLVSDFALIAADKEDPHEINVYHVLGESMAAANEQIRIALSTIKKIKEEPLSWRGYPLGRKEISI